MGKYRVLEPVVFPKGSKVIQYIRPADLVDIDDEVAATLGDKVERRGAPAEPEPAAEPVVEPEAPVDPKSRRRPPEGQ